MYMRDQTINRGGRLFHVIGCVVGKSLTERETSSARRFFDEEQRLESLKNQDSRYLYKSRDCLWNKTSPKRKKGVRKIATFAREHTRPSVLRGVAIQARVEVYGFN